MQNNLKNIEGLNQIVKRRRDDWVVVQTPLGSLATFFHKAILNFLYKLVNSIQK